MTTSRYTIAPPSLTPLLMEYGEYEHIPDECWREYIAAHRFWARAWEMYAGPDPAATRKRRKRERGASAVGTLVDAFAERERAGARTGEVTD